jgi:peptidoglycan/LPS O-acetylase OafA/YrhL
MVKRLLQLNGLAIISVVLFHSGGMGFNAMFAWAHRYLPEGVAASQQIGSLSYYYLRTIDQLVVFSIPAFLFVSGYFMAVATGKNRETPGWGVIWSRVKYLIIPYLIWSVVVFVLLFIEGKDVTVQKVIISLLIGDHNEAMYYVPLLVQFYLISPLLVLFAKRNWKALLIVTGFIQLMIILLPYPLYLGLEIPNAQALSGLVPKWFFPSRILWFSLGIIFGLNLTLFKQFVNRYKWLLLSITLVSIPIGLMEWELFFNLSGVEWLDHRATLVDMVYSVALIFAFLGFSDAKLPLSKTLSDLGIKSYGIYLVHAIVIWYAARVFYHFTPWLLGQQIFLQLILFILGLGVPLLTMAIVNRSPLRRYYKFLFG